MDLFCKTSIIWHPYPLFYYLPEIKIVEIKTKNILINALGSGPIAFIFVHKKQFLLTINNEYNYEKQTKINPIPSKLIFCFFYELFRNFRLAYASTPTLKCTKKINAMFPLLIC